MEILRKFKDNGYFTAEIYHLLHKKKLVDMSEEIIPSEYQKEMRMSTVERLQNLNNIEIDNVIHSSKTSPKAPLSFTPRIIVFQNFKPNDKIVAKFLIKNISSASTHLNMIFKESSYFSIKLCGGQMLCRLAPGIAITFSITFTPHQFEDYAHRVTFVTDTEHYVLPLIAIGPRPIFNFPDEIILPKIPLKVESYQHVLIQNNGVVPAGFTFNTKTPFLVQPKSAYLHPDKNLEFKIIFKSMHFGTAEGVVYAVFETGENFRIKVFGEAHTVSIQLEKEVIRFLDTFNTMARQQTFKIFNKSDNMISYACMQNVSIYKDFDDKLQLATTLYDLKLSESAKYRKLVQYDVLTSDEHERAYTRIFYDEIQGLVVDESLFFNSTPFSIMPIKGKLWPNKMTEVTVTFSPKEIGEFEATAYLDIDGVTDRVPLKIVGTSLPPSIHLNVETLDMDCVYINNTYNYEIVAINNGHINGVIVYKSVAPLFGSVITCTPEMYCLRPGEKEMFIISFYNSNQGPYFEEVNFIIRDTSVVLKLYLKGTIIYPSLMFGIPCLDFERVSVGVPKVLEFEVINESVVNVIGTVKISSDGPEISSITLEDCAVADDTTSLQFPQWPREFNIEPSKIEMGPESRITLKVTLIANMTRANQTSLEIELEKSDSPPITLPVRYNAVVPEITPASDINLRACFVDFSYKHEIVLTANDASGYFTIEEPQGDSTLEVDVAIKRGKVEPNSTIVLPVTIKTAVLGLQEYYIRMYLFGSSKPFEICHITGCGVRPIVTCAPMSLHWGQVKLLAPWQKTLTLCNDSPVDVYFHTWMLNRDGRWQIHPADGFVPPESETDLTLTLYLLDAGTYTNKAVIQLEKVKDIYVPLSATGVGTSIIVGEARDRILLGRHFTKLPLVTKITIENFGTRMHSLEWNEHYKSPKTKQYAPSFFNLEPKLFKIAAGEKVEMTLTALSNKAQVVNELWFLVGSIEGVNKKELLLECPIVAEFVDPKAVLSSNLINFRYDYGPYSEYYKLTDIVSIKNISKLPIDIDIIVKPPFAIIHKQDTYKVLPEEENMCGCIEYRESDLNIANIMKACDAHQSKIFIDCLTHKPVEPLRQGNLHFFEDINKIKMAFNLTHSVQERLEDQEIMKIQILFDTTKHLSLKSRVYCDLMRIKFVGLKNKDAVKLIGKINFPNLVVMTPRVDFQCILNGCIESKTIKLQNATPLLVCYKFQWKKCSIVGITLPDMPNPNLSTNMSKLITLDELERSVRISETSPSEVNNILPNELSRESEAEENGKVINELIGPMSDAMISQDAEVDEEVIKTKILQKISPMMEPENNTGFSWTYKFSRHIKYNEININEIFQLTPHRGLLKPNAIDYVHVIFKPKNNISVKATLELEVLGGPSETIMVMGQSSELMYTINTKRLNFGIRSFHEKAIEQLIISNIAPLHFDYTTYLNEPKFKNELEGTILDLLPPEKILASEEEVHMDVVVRPGVVGYFERVFLLEIGHLLHIPIDVYGWGVIPQIYLSLPRPHIGDLPVEFGYLAILSLTLDYLAAISEIFSLGTPEHVNSVLTEKCFEDPDLQPDWHLCSSWDGYPSIMDIELAIERMLVASYIKLRPDLLTNYSKGTKCGPIPGFLTSPYLIDFGVVITGSTVHCSADIINYGPIVTRLHFAKTNHTFSWLSVKLCGKLNPGETGKLDVTFSPTSLDFTELEQNFETYFKIEVPYGVTMPIYVKALCAVPYLKSNITSLDFGSVRCGDKIISNIPLKNVGRPTCIWYVTLKLKAVNPVSMVILNNSGKYEPGESGWMSISFKPSMEMIYEGLLIFRFHMNPTKMTIPVRGQGVVPHVHIIGPNVNFPPTLPWAQTTDYYFGLTNPCPFPIELIMAHCDKKWKQEEKIFQLLYRYHNKPEEMLVPAIIPGVGLPSIIMNFYDRFQDGVQRAMDEETASRSSSGRASVKAMRSPKKVPKLIGAKDFLSMRKIRTEAEIIADEIKMLKEEGVNPLKECLEAVEEKSSNSNNDKLKGLLVFMHGSPCEEMHCQEIAHSLGKKLGIPVLNLDLGFVEALCVSNCSAKSILLTVINDIYDYEFRKKFLEKDNDDEETQGSFGEHEDEVDILLKKIEFVAANKNVGTPRSKASNKTKKDASSVASHTLDAHGSTTMFHLDLVLELLTDYFSQPKFTRGFILDSLTSIVIKNPPVVLTTIIKSKPTIRNMHLVLCQSDFNKWSQAYEETQRKLDMIDENVTKVYDETEIQEIIESFEEMDEEEYENSPPEHKAIYIAHGLKVRRQKFYKKWGITEEIVQKEKSEKVKENSSGIVVDVESKKKMKKDDNKGKPTNEYINMNIKYNEYAKNTYDALINIANNWIIEENELGFPLYAMNGQIVGATQKKSKKKSEIHLQLSEVVLTERGFPLTLIMCPCIIYKEAVVDMFANTPLVVEALKEEEEFDILQCPVERKEFTVLLPKTMPVFNHEAFLQWRFLDEVQIRKCECNQITDINLLDDTTQDNVLNILSKWHCKCAKKVASSQTSTSDFPSLSIDQVDVEEEEEIYPQPKPLTKVKSLSVYEGERLVLQPGDLVRCKYSFSPREEGTFRVKRFIEVYGWPDSRVDLNVSGICDIPRLDNRPKKMFENFVRRTVPENVYKVTYLDDLKMFEFGPIFIGSNRTYEEEYTMDLKNSSLLTAEVVIQFLEDSTVFMIDKIDMVLEPGCRGKLTLSAAPADVGDFTSVLLLCVKDNPEIVEVKIGCSGVVPIVEVLPQSKLIDYGKLLLYRREDDRFIIKNESILPIMWTIRNAEEFVEDFIIAQTTGIIPRYDNQVVPVTYIACQVGIITNKSLIIDVYDELGRGEPMFVDMLFLSAECYDVMVECAFENPGDTSLNYGNVKVNSAVYRDLYLLNRGKYNIYYRLKKVKNFPEPSLLRTLQAFPECGMIAPVLKLAAIEFECTPMTSFNLVNVPAYTCSLLDGSKDQVVVAKFPICVTIASYYNTFTLFPLGELNFHIIAVGSGVMREVILNNTSKCPFTYEIVLPPQYQEQAELEAATPKTKPDKKIKIPSMKCGNFLILSEDNLLPPGTSRTIQIQFLATAARKFEETIKFVISDTCPAEATGVPLKLIGVGAMPILDFWNLETTFREHLIVKTASEYTVPEPTPHCAFVEDTATLHFYCVPVKTSYIASIDLYNCGLVPCILSMRVQYQSNTNQNILSLDKYETHIEPLLHRTLGIIFTPTALEEYRAVVEIKLKLLHNEEQSFKLCVIGEGVIPRIRLLSPVVKQHKLAVMQFPVTCLGSVSHKFIRFKNISTLNSSVVLNVIHPYHEGRPVFWLNATTKSQHMVVMGDTDSLNSTLKVVMRPQEVAIMLIYFNPIKKGKASCDVNLTIVDNPYEYFMVLCEGEAFMEDVILVGLEMLSMDADLEQYKSGTGTAESTSTADSKKKSKSAPAPAEKRRSKTLDQKKLKKQSLASMKNDDFRNVETSVLKYIINFGGCELCSIQKRSFIMVNNSDKVYKFNWLEAEHIVIKPSIGYISPGEEKDVEIIFFSAEPVNIYKKSLTCILFAINDDTLSINLKGSTWDNRQTMTQFEQNVEVGIHERNEVVIDEQTIPPSDDVEGMINMIIVYSITTEYTKYMSTLPEENNLKDTFIYQKRQFDFKVENIGGVPMKIVWSFHIDDEYPARIDKKSRKEENEPLPAPQSEAVTLETITDGTNVESVAPENINDKNVEEDDRSKVTLFSGSEGRESIDSWFEVDLPFQIEPASDCLRPGESRVFTVTFKPQEAFDFTVRLKSSIENLDPYDQNMSCKITGKSLIPYCHLDLEESDYLTSGRRKITGHKLPPHMNVLEFNVLGIGCYKKTFKVINPTREAYEFTFEMVLSDKPELIPVHCNMLKGFIEGGTSTAVTFTFAPTAPGVYESQWKFNISTHSLVMHLMVVGIVREPDVVFVPPILTVRNSLVGFTTTNNIILKNCENENLKFEYKGNSLSNESGLTAIIVEPADGVLKPRSETSMKIIYTPIQDGALSFKIFFSITYLTKVLTLCVKALSLLIKPTVTYHIIGNEHVLNSDATTNIHLDQTASTYERHIPFTIKNDGSATFFFDWHHINTAVKKYLQVNIEPRNGHVAPATEVVCKLSFTLKQVPVVGYPVTLSITDGPVYNISLHAEIEKPSYYFFCKEHDFGKCIVNAPERTYKKNLAFVNDDKVPITLDLNFANLPELFVDYETEPSIEPQQRVKIPVYFRPNQVKEYEFKLQFWVNSLCEEIITIKGEGVPLLVDLYEGCQKSFNLGPVKVGQQIIRQISVLNHSKVPIDARFIFKTMYNIAKEGDDINSEGTSICLDPTAALPPDTGPSRVKMVKQYQDSKAMEQIQMDVQNALASLHVEPSRCIIKPHTKVPLKIHFKPVGIISKLDVQLNALVFEFEKPMVRLSGSATGMSFSFSQTSLQFGRVRKHGCRILKVMLMNKGDFTSRFCWQPLISDEFKITPMSGLIEAHTNVTFSITFRPINHNPFVKVWASCNIENYEPQDIALFATCMNIGVMQNQTLFMDCPVREVVTYYITVTNPNDEVWLVLSELTGLSFDTPREFNVDPNSTFDIPVHFKPKTIGRHEGQVCYSPLGESALVVSLIAVATHPNPNGDIHITVRSKYSHTEPLPVYNFTEFPETYLVSAEIVKVVPDKFEGYYEISYPETVKVWGEATGTCRWTYICFEPCEMTFKVMFVNEETREYQFYNITVTVTPSVIIDTLTYVSRARESLQKEIPIKNPLATDVEFVIQCESISCPDVLKIARNSVAKLLTTFSPLVVGEAEDTLSVSNHLIGTYVYRVLTKCLPAKEKDMEVTTSLGSCIPIRLRLQNKTDMKADFIATVTHPSILLEKDYSLGPLLKGKFLVWFEPMELGTQNSTLSFKSAVAGEFVFTIKGKATDPKPQGPFDIRPGGFTTIRFKNVFDNTRTFKIYVDREEFYLKTMFETIKPKKDVRVPVYMCERPARGWAELPAGCVTVECHEPAEPRAQWTYFLQGIP